MKKIALIAMVVMTSVLSYAQEPTPTPDTEKVLTSKRGHEILPRKGDIALGFNTVPMIDFLLNSLNHVSLFGGAGGTSSGTASSAVQYTSNSNNQIVGKYFLDPKTAVRVRFGYNTLSGSITNPVQDAIAMDAASQGTPQDIAAASLIKVDDKLNFHKSNVVVAIGYEKRRGYHRLIGFYGGEFGVGRTNANQQVSYGNIFTDVYESDYTTNFNTLATATLDPSTTSRVSRNLDTKYGGTWRFGARGFIGVEYFVFPKISVGAEFGWGFSVTRQKNRREENETYFNGQSGPEVVIEEKEVNSSNNTTGFAVDSNNGQTYSLNNTLNGNTSLSGGSGAIILLFHF